MADAISAFEFLECNSVTVADHLPNLLGVEAPSIEEMLAVLLRLLSKPNYMNCLAPPATLLSFSAFCLDVARR